MSWCVTGNARNVEDLETLQMDCREIWNLDFRIQDLGFWESGLEVSGILHPAQEHVVRERLTEACRELGLCSIAHVRGSGKATVELNSRANAEQAVRAISQITSIAYDHTGHNKKRLRATLSTANAARNFTQVDEVQLSSNKYACSKSSFDNEFKKNYKIMCTQRKAKK